MLRPAPITRLDPKIARGVLVQLGPDLAGKPESLVVEFPNTNYQLHLTPTGPITTPVGKRILGTIHADARRIDVVGTGGRYLEPVYGTPVRAQGTIVAITDEAVVINAGVPIHCSPTERGQKPSDFEEGQLVGCALMPGVSFTEREPG